MTEQEALAIAKKFLAEKNTNGPGKGIYKWILTKPKDIGQAWYFDFEYELDDPDRIVHLESVPGFLIQKETQEIETVWWEDHKRLFPDPPS